MYTVLSVSVLPGERVNTQFVLSSINPINEYNDKSQSVAIYFYRMENLGYVTRYRLIDHDSYILCSIDCCDECTSLDAHSLLQETMLFDVRK